MHVQYQNHSFILAKYGKDESIIQNENLHESFDLGKHTVPTKDIVFPEGTKFGMYSAEQEAIYDRINTFDQIFQVRHYHSYDGTIVKVTEVSINPDFAGNNCDDKVLLGPVTKMVNE